MNIVCATDDNFVQHCSIMLVSLLSNNSNVCIYILTEGLKPENKLILENEVANYKGKLNFCIVDSNVVEKFPMPSDRGFSHISRATYYRLLMAELLPSDLDKIIYLDCDIIINGSLEELWNINIEGYAIAASKQIGYGFEAERLGYPINYGYFNAGVNVVNLKYWRDFNVKDSLLQYIERHFESIKYHDQDTLNAVLYDKCYYIMPKWNMTSLTFSLFLNTRGDSRNGVIINDYSREKNNIKQNLKHPIVIHYVSHPKPWNDGCIHPYYYLYYDYAKKTINYKRIERPNHVKHLLLLYINNILSVLSLIKQKIMKTDLTRL